MDKDSLLRSIAEMGYNVGFGAKKHFATYDIVENVPGVIGFISIAIGILSLVFEPLSTKLLSACLTIAGVLVLYINLFDHCKDDYEKTGRALTVLFNRLRDLYRQVVGGADVVAAHAELKVIEAEYYASGVSKQIVGSDWCAHYKFFAQMQIAWIHEQKKFSWRDKVPVSLRVWAILVVAAVIIQCGFLVARWVFAISCI
nr:SLATT domain-containing protein [uncultured Brevundimonas sp.]